jgi:hypothetical protein
VSRETLTTEHAAQLARDLMQPALGAHGLFASIRVDAGVLLELAQWVIDVIGADADGAHGPRSNATAAAIAGAAIAFPDALNDLAAEIAEHLAPAETGRLIGALLRALDGVSP